MATTLIDFLSKPVTGNPYLVYPILPKGGKLFIYAPKKHQKSLVLFNIVYELANGWPILGNKYWLPKREYSTLLIEQELGEFRCHERFGKLHQYRGGQYAENISIIPKDRNFRLDKPAGFELLRKELLERQYDILALDPIRKFHRQDENDSTAITGVVDAMDRLIAEFGITLIICHHAGHGDLAGKVDHMRGSSIWMDEADTIIKIDRPNSANRKEIRITPQELRDSDPPLPFTIRLNPDTYTYDYAELK